MFCLICIPKRFLCPVQVQTQAFFRRAVTELVSGVPPRDEHALEVDSNPFSILAIDQLTASKTLTAFLSAVLNKKYTNPSADVIEVLAGLDDVDKLITELVSGLDRLIRAGSTCQLQSLVFSSSFILMMHSRTSEKGHWNCPVLDLKYLSNWASDLSHSSRSLSCNRQGKTELCQYGALINA
jgi:hypothetical protein